MNVDEDSKGSPQTALRVPDEIRIKAQAFLRRGGKRKDQSEDRHDMIHGELSRGEGEGPAMNDVRVFPEQQKLN